jgi:hypothetical protein
VLLGDVVMETVNWAPDALLGTALGDFERSMIQEALGGIRS